MPHDPESLIAPGLTPRRPSGRVTWVEERSHGLSEVPKGLLLHRLGSGGKPKMLCPRLCELPALLQVARRAAAAEVPVGVLLDGQVPHVPGMATMLGQRRRLLSGR
jgi:hypothetical protein